MTDRDLKLSRRTFLELGAAAVAGAALTSCGGGKADDGRVYDVVIVGAGLAGLTAGRELARAGVDDFVIVEARDRVGGRTLNQSIAGGAGDVAVEAGGQWVGPTQTAILALAAELGVDTFPTFDTGETLLYFDGIRFLASQLPDDPVEAADLAQAKAALNALAATIPVDAPWTAPDADALDDTTVATWLADNTTTAGARFELELEIASALSTSPAQLSLLYFLYYIASAGSVEVLGDIAGGAQERRIVGGSQVLSLRMAEALAEQIVLSAPVSRIEATEALVHVDTAAGRFTARRVVVALMPSLSDRLEFVPALPADRASLAAAWPSTAAGYKAHLSYPQPFWRADGLSGIALADDPRVGLVFDNSPPSGDPGVLLVFGDPAALPDGSDARRQAIADALVPIFGQAAASPIGFTELDWSEETFSAGCVSPLAPGVLTQFGPALRAPVGRIHWAGTETSPIWTGYMEGAVRSGQRIAAELLPLLE